MYKVEKILYYKVGEEAFPTEKEAKQYALLLFLKDGAEKRWKYDYLYKNYSIYIEDNKIRVHIYEPTTVFEDNWNAGHYGCTGTTVYKDNSKDETYNSIADFYNIYSELVDQILDEWAYIDLDKMKNLCTEEVYEEMAFRKELSNELKKQSKKFNYEISNIDNRILSC